MDSLITFGIDKMELDWSKGYLLRDYSTLFNESDKSQLLCYYYDDSCEEIKTTQIIGYSKKLSRIKRRLELLGYTLSSIKVLYEEMILNSFIPSNAVKLSFEDFYSIFYLLDVSKIDTTKERFCYPDDFEYGEFVRLLFTDNEALLDPVRRKLDLRKNELPSELMSFIETLENLDPLIVLRILVENPKNSDLDIFWICPESMFIDNESFDVSESNRIMIVTEGTSDLSIIKRTIDSLYEDVSDLFLYIDMEDNYPFTGTGNLKNFCIGLNRIRIQNNVIVIFDNDAAGCGSYNAIKDNCNVSNLLIIKLPDYDEFNSIDTIGPQGVTKENINGRAVAIECFLDFNSVSMPPRIRWKSYDDKQKIYQGAIENKEQYTKAFYSSNLTDGTYDTSKLSFLMEYIFSSWINRKTIG